MLGLHFVEANDVVAKLGLDRLADFASLQGEQLVGKGLHIGAAQRPAQIAALARRPRILRIFLRQRRKIAAGTRFLQHLLRLGERRGFGSGIFAAANGYEYVPGAALLGFDVAVLVLFVPGFEIGGIDRQRGSDRIQP